MMGLGLAGASRLREMSSIAESQPRTGRRNFNLRAYLAGTAATAALIGAVVLAFASLGAYVAFNGLPVGDDSQGVTSSISVEQAVAPVAAAKQSRGQDLAFTDARRDQAAGQGSSGANGGSAESGAQTSVLPADTAPAAGGTSQTTATAGGDVDTTATPTPAQSGPSADPPSSDGIPTPQVTNPSSIGGTVGQVEQTLNDAGVSVPLTGSGSAVEEVTGGLLGND
jgi:hypothetical protein